MSQVLRQIRTFLSDESGPTAVEYAVMLVMIIVVCIVGVSLLGSNTNNTFEEAATMLETAS